MTKLWRFSAVALGMLILTVTADLYAARQAPTTVMRLVGAAAKAHIDRMYRQNPRLRADHDRNALALAARGWKPAADEHYLVEIQTRKQLPLQRVASLFVPSVAAQSFGLGDATLILSPWDAGDPDVFASEVTIVGNDGDWISGAFAARISTGTVEWDTAPWVRRWGLCTLGGCVAGGVGCFLTGPGWGACAAIRCASAFAGCGVMEYGRYLCGKRYIGC